MPFDVLSQDIAINSQFLVEASAGTGKTFTIEHLFIRRLLEPKRSGEYTDPAEIAVLTFTRACARELTDRIKNSLETTIEGILRDETPEYIKKAIAHQGQAAVLGRLVRSAFSLESAFIGTMHSFCERVIVDWQGQYSEEHTRACSDEEIERMVNDFFRYSISEDPLEQTVLATILGSFRNNFSSLRTHLINTLWNEVEPTATCDALFLSLYNSLKDKTLFFEDIPCFYIGCCRKDGTVKDELDRAIQALRGFLQTPESITARRKVIRHPLVVGKWFSKPKAKKELPEFVTESVRVLFQVEDTLRALSNPVVQIRALQKRVFDYVSMRMREAGLYSFKGLLHVMKHALGSPEFFSYVRKRFSCLIVDEFQDTDPVQWDIITSITKDRDDASVYLVGDPKQAIYAFRNADVYTYMQAKDTVCTSPYVLTSNFRSRPRLLNALNELFSGVHADRLFYLPKTGESIVPPALLCGRQKDVEDDTEPSVVFFQADGPIGRKRRWPTEEVERKLFSFIAKEIVLLADYPSCAVLVKDRHQQMRLETYLRERSIPVCSYAKRPIAGSDAHVLLKKLIAWMLSPRSKKALAAFVIEKPFCYTEQMINRIFDDGDDALPYWAEHVSWIYALKQVYEERGFFHFFQAFLDALVIGAHNSVTNAILALANGRELIGDLERLYDVCAENEMLPSILETLERLTDEELFAIQDPVKQGVHVMTLHAAKGLEFDYVFALGLVCRHSVDEESVEEVHAEKLRLFYVAATRAKKKLFIPVAQTSDREKISYNAMSPSELFVEALNKTAGIGSLEQFCAEHRTLFSHSVVSDDECESRMPFEEVTFQKKPAIEFFPRLSKEYISSFSQMNTGTLFDKHELGEQSLVSGVHCGIAIHALFNTIGRLSSSCGALLNEDAIERLIRADYAHGFFEGKHEAILELVLGAFHCPLHTPTATFTLSEISWKTALCEAEFVMKKSDHGWIRGVIDLAFEYRGCWYLVDYKSTFLADGYAPENLARTVLESGYAEQAKLYSKAFSKTVSSFGGFFFLFIRDAVRGGYFLSPSEVLS